jgi:hypothetical protein
MSIDIWSAPYEVPTVTTDPMYTTVQRINVSTLTSGVVDGSGVFDKLMSSLKAQLKGEKDAGRITGNEYTKAYIEMTQMALQTALQFTLGQDQAFWTAQQAQIAAVTARIQLETARFNYDSILPATLAQTQAQTALINSQKIGSDTQNSISTYNLNSILPAQLAQAVAETGLTNAQKAGVDMQTSITSYNLANILPASLAQAIAQTTMTNAQTAMTNSQKIGQDDQNAILAYQLANLLPAQVNLVKEQTEVQHAQTSGTLRDGTTVVAGLIGQQVALYTQQVTSYKRDSENKFAKFLSDAWITQKTMDETIVPPTIFTNTTIDSVLGTMRTNNGL